MENNIYGLETICGVIYKDNEYCQYIEKQDYSTYFKIGDVIQLKDGDGRHHIIKEIQWEYDVHGNKYIATVIFEDNAAKGFISETYTDMIKVY